MPPKNTKKTEKTVASSSQKTTQKRKIVEDESETSSSAPAPKLRRSSRVSSQSSNLAEVFRSLELGSEDLPSSASLYRTRDLELLKVTFVNAEAENIVIPDVEVDPRESQKYMLDNINRKVLGNITFKVKDHNEITDDEVKTFFKKLHQVVVNGIQVAGTDETLTDTFVDDLLRVTKFNRFPLMIRNHPMKKLYIEGEAIVSADPEFVITKINEELDNMIEELSILVVEDKHIKNVSASSGFGESQIAIEIIASGSSNLRSLGQVDPVDQTIWAMRVISSYVTFYKAVITSDYWEELEKGLPKDKSVTIHRWPARNGLMTGFDLANPDDRKNVFVALAKIRESLLVEDSGVAEVVASGSNLTSA